VNAFVFVEVKNFYLVILIALASVFFVTNVSANVLEPQALVEQVAEKTIKRLKVEKERIDKEPNYVNAVINELLIPHFDFERMARWTLGKHWRKAKSDQKKAFVEEFKSLLVRTYASSLREFADQEIKYSPFRGVLESGDVTVRSEIEQPGGFPIPINYKLFLKDARWMVYDITIDDISLISNYRSSFSRQIRKTGLDKLILDLADKNK